MMMNVQMMVLTNLELNMMRKLRRSRKKMIVSRNLLPRN